MPTNRQQKKTEIANKALNIVDRSIICICSHFHFYQMAIWTVGHLQIYGHLPHFHIFSVPSVALSRQKARRLLAETNFDGHLERDSTRDNLLYTAFTMQMLAAHLNCRNDQEHWAESEHVTSLSS